MRTPSGLWDDSSTFVVTTDGGNTWRTGVVPTQNAADIQLRDVQGVSAQIAYVLSIGNLPGDFAIYKTTDGGATWTLQFQNQLVGAFYDCFAFWTPTSGIAHQRFGQRRLSRPAHHRWHDLAEHRQNYAARVAGEASFSSSGTCIATQGKSNAWIMTGNSPTARILATTDGGNTWTAYNTPCTARRLRADSAWRFATPRMAFWAAATCRPATLPRQRNSRPRMTAARPGS